MQTSPTSRVAIVPCPPAPGSVARAWVLALAAPAVIVGSFAVSGCRNDEVGRTTTVEKTTVDTPAGETTVTETHHKETKLIPK
ncbi:MAG: hypothetical protein SGJ11_02170 [Phycisphaerae bacterium]|nr:hypothetical protein [Phycisphaerae bacterium]